jgi:hypothetical protein
MRNMVRLLAMAISLTAASAAAQAATPTPVAKETTPPKPDSRSTVAMSPGIAGASADQGGGFICFR